MVETIIYNRTSKEEQNPENQLEDCKAVIDRLGIKDYEIFQEHKSAWKDDFKRKIFNEIRNAIKKKEIKTLLVWDLDRLYRNRKKLIAFFKFCKSYNCKIYSFRQRFLEDINNAPEPWNEMLYDNMVFILGWMAEDESNKRSERIRASLKKNKNGRTVSKYGKIWGRRRLSKRTIEQIIKLYEEGKKFREISNQVHHWIKGNKKFVSIGVVHKVVSKYKKEKLVNEGGS